MRRVGVLIGTAESDPEFKRRVDALVGGLRDAGWIEGRNVRLDYRFSSADPDRMRRYAMEIVDLRPDVIVVHSNDFLAALLQAGTARYRPSLRRSAIQSAAGLSRAWPIRAAI